jgi:hypothetical protein
MNLQLKVAFRAPLRCRFLPTTSSRRRFIGEALFHDKRLSVDNSRSA